MDTVISKGGNAEPHSKDQTKSCFYMDIQMYPNVGLGICLTKPRGGSRQFFLGGGGENHLVVSVLNLFAFATVGYL